MNKVIEKLTVLFEDPFWVGVFERIENGKMSVAKITFGAEPKDYEVADFIMKYAYRLKYSPDVTAVVKETSKNPKRMQREVKKQLQNTAIGTKSQQALKLQQEQFKTERRVRKKDQKEAELERMYELKQQQRKEKHKGH